MTANLSRVRLLGARLLPPRNRFLADGLAITGRGGSSSAAAA